MSLNQRHYLEDQRHYVTPWPVASRAGNPATSHQAEAEHTKGQFRYTNSVLLMEAIHAKPGSIREELAWASSLTEYEASKRLSDLERLHKIRKGPPRRAAGSGRNQSTWWPTEAA
jgi:hypothetical protein